VKTPREIADAVFALTAIELLELNQILADEGGSPPISVREPRAPAPETGAAGAEAGWPTPSGLPEDYWESAE